MLLRYRATRRLSHAGPVMLEWQLFQTVRTPTSLLTISVLYVVRFVRVSYPAQGGMEDMLIPEDMTTDRRCSSRDAALLFPPDRGRKGLPC